MLNEPLLEPSSSQDSSNNANVGELNTVGSSSSTNNDASTTASSSLLGTGSGVGDYEADAAAGGIKQSPTSPALHHNGGSEKKLSAFVLAVISFFNAAGKYIMVGSFANVASYCNICITCASLIDCN